MMVVGNSRTCTDNLLHSLKGAGLYHLDFFQVHEDDEESPSRSAGAKVVVCASAMASRLPKLGIPAGVEVSLQERPLSKGGVELLGLCSAAPPELQSLPAQERTLKRFIAASGSVSITASTASAASGTASLIAESIRPST
jgi:hypothetical protein